MIISTTQKQSPGAAVNFYNLGKFTGKLLCWSLSFNKVTGLWPVTLFGKSLRQRCFHVNFAKFLSTLFLMNTSGGCF